MPGTDEEWQAAVKNAQAQLEHQRLRYVLLLHHEQLVLIVRRQSNATLLQTYGSNAWRIHNYLLEANSQQIEKALEDLKQLTVDLNRERKNSQVRVPFMFS